MRIARTVAEFRQVRAEWNHPTETVSLVPTMGALHSGHLSLIELAQDADRVVVSIFVNPTQFGPDEDFHRYPRSLDRDLALIESLRVDALFLPEVSEMYPAGHATVVSVDDLSQRLCGKSRPTHFAGVTTVVAKLFNIIQPDIAVFGQKDAQQAVIIKRMVKDLCLGVKTLVGPTIRESDGLALSSRNKYLNSEERKAATVLFKSLERASNAVAAGERRSQRLLQSVGTLIAEEPLASLDYAEIVDPDNLKPVALLERPSLLALAVFFGTTRLIDNILLDVHD